MAEITIEVAFATPEKQTVLKVTVPEGSNLIEAVRLSGIADHFPNENLEAMPKGIWSEKKPDEQKLQDGDRVEIYRPLINDPKEARRKRAQNPR